jgi:hypothetical protein
MPAFPMSTVKLRPRPAETRVLTAVLSTLLLGAPGCLAHGLTGVASEPSVAYVVVADEAPEKDDESARVADKPSQPEEERVYRPAKPTAEPSGRRAVKVAKPKTAEKEPVRKRIQK